ncbi:SUMO-specific isopeptidase USPL1 isoform X2 [Vanacampus margaritifer]
MVILLEWQQAAAADPGRSGAVEMPGEDAGSGARASPPVGYLGKVQERTASLDCCPWCASKGLRSSLRSYRLNLHESITLCTEPQCLFPLVSRPLEDVLASLVPAETAAGGRKRKTLSQVENKDDYQEVKVKRLRSDQPHAYAGSTVPNGHHRAAVTRAELSGGVSGPPQDGAPHRTAARTAAGSACRLSEENASSPFSAAPQTDKDDGDTERLGKVAGETGDACHQLRSVPEGPVDAPKEPVASRVEPVDSPGQRVDRFLVSVDVPEKRVETSTESVNQPSEELANELVGIPAEPDGGAPPCLFWKNTRNLCWLDVLLVVLVNCGSLRRRKPQHEPPRAAVWRLMSGYDGACDALQAGSDGEARDWRGADERMQNLRTSAFDLLRPQLRCKLGQRESPVFAMPLLLAADSWAEPLFQTTFRWEFECAECKTVTTERVTKTLPTFTNIVADWHPMRATHFAVCNACGAQHQRRSMKLERVAAVLALHFVDGVPHGDVGALAFTLEGRRHQVTALVQYEQRAQHFVAWTRTPDGSWLEFDDLKHPQVVRHPTLPVPAREVHLVFWEADAPGSGACSPSSTQPDSPPPRSVAPERRVLASDEEGNVSIGSVTLLDAFHGLSHDDIVTLTLTEVGADTPMDHKAPLDCIPAPDSSSPTPEDPGEGPPLSAESDDAAADKDPDFDPTSGKAQTRNKRISKAKRQPARKTAKMKAPPEVDRRVRRQPAQDSRQPAQASEPPLPSVQRASPVSSTGPPSPPLDHNSRWSFLVNQHFANQRPSTTKPPPAPVNHVQHPPSHSTPVPARGPPAPKPQLLHMEDGDGLPLKAAEMFGAFGAAVQSPPPFPKKSKMAAGSSAPGAPVAPGDTEALRYKLLKKLKAKKKKLAKLNQLLACRPDSTALVSPVGVGASGTCDGFFPSDLLQPSPDSSGFLDLLAGRQDGTPDTPPPSQTEHFLDEFLSMTPAVTEAQRAMEDETLKELELFLA